MKATFALVAVTLLWAGSAWAGPETIIKQRAKELRDQNNVRQGVAPPTQPASAAPAAAAPVISSALGRLQADLAALKAGVPATAVQKQKLIQDVLAVAEGAKPSTAAVTKFVEDITGAFAEKPLAAEARNRLTLELDAILNPAKYPKAKPDGIFADVQAIFQANGLARRNAVALSDDVKALSAEIQAGGAK